MDVCQHSCMYSRTLPFWHIQTVVDSVQKIEE